MTTAALLQGETFLLTITRHLLSLRTPATLCQGGLSLLADLLGADIAMMHAARSGDEFRMVAHVGHHPFLALHERQIMRPSWRAALMAGAWHCQVLSPEGWDGPDELNYLHLGARQLVCFGLHSGERLVGYVGLLFSNPRPDLDGLGVLATLGALWGTLLDRMDTEAALRAREALLRSITDNGTDIVTVVDESGVIVHQSASCTPVLGYDVSEMLGRVAFDLVHPEDRPDLEGLFARFVSEPGLQLGATFRFRHRDGPYLWIECRGRNLLHDPDVRGAVLHSRDVSDQQRTRERLEERVQDLTLMHAASQTLAHARTVEEVVERVGALLHERLGHEYVRVERVGPDGRAVMVGGGETDAALLPSEGLVGACISSGETVLVNDVLSDPRYLAVRPDVRSELVVPLHVGGRIWGALNVESVVPEAFGDEDRRALETIAAQTGTALANVMLLDELRLSHERLQSAYDNTIAGWARALDYRDRETEGHSQRVTELAVRLARRMGLPEDEIVHLRRGALLHDIGKMGIPDDVLRKSGPLSEHERAVMQRHPEMAVALLSPIEFLAPALDIPRAHHEHWDGGGYPLGVSGHDIPRAARIFSVVDVWDALLSDRPYRAAWTREEARAHIERQSGRIFDPEVVRVFLATLDEHGPDV